MTVGIGAPLCSSPFRVITSSLVDMILYFLFKNSIPFAGDIFKVGVLFVSS